MKSSSNTTDFDDKLFFQVITESMKKLFICPVGCHYSIQKPEKEDEQSDGIQQFRFVLDKIDSVHNIADGKIIQVTKDGPRSQVIIEHDNGIQTWFMADFAYGVPSAGVELRQGDIIGHCKEFYLAVCISPKTLFPG